MFWIAHFSVFAISRGVNNHSRRVAIMISKSGLVLCLALVACLPAAHGQLGFGKAVIEYLGSTFLMADGCPPPKCDVQTEECKHARQMVRALYSHCLQSEDGQHVGCISDRLGDGSTITVPIYATMCSAMCYEPNPRTLKKIVRCPYPGYRQHNAALSNLF